MLRKSTTYRVKYPCFECNRLCLVYTGAICAHTQVLWSCFQATSLGDQAEIASLEPMKRLANEARRTAHKALVAHKASHGAVILTRKSENLRPLAHYTGTCSKSSTQHLPLSLLGGTP